ncbi:MAG TPA: hypothetical protein DDZ80_15475 [Cyanobacteria bacterium UBA8803]|nr:hypothetical protein [Cyanobacteria bacterium UBA9273]HBL59818.1 hypothetical protein [Cyanobacteria bacterium UBA8803]
MTSQLSLNEPFEEFIPISASTTLSKALEELEKSGKPFAVVIDVDDADDAKNRPQTLLQKEHLLKLLNQENNRLAEIQLSEIL